MTLDMIIDNDNTFLLLFIKGRHIGDNIRKLYDIMKYSKFHNIPGLMLLVDFDN